MQLVANNEVLHRLNEMLMQGKILNFCAKISPFTAFRNLILLPLPKFQQELYRMV
jgi:hypothetical protein